jgi:asparagine synthase (glutamine-hydrolysing)
VTGIAGVVGNEPAGPAALAQRLADGLRIVPGSEVDFWSDARAALCRVRNPAVDGDPQPVFSRDRGKCALLYGECIAHEDARRELVRKGHVLAAEPAGCEYAMRLFEEHGEAAFARLSGSYCLVIYDAADGSVRVVSDRLGSRPVFYGRIAGGGLAFASRVSPLLQAPGISAELETSAVLEFCTLQKVLGAKTYHRGVSMLPPASILHFGHGGIRLSRYWTPEYRPQEGTLDRYAEELAETMRAAMGDVTRGPDRAGVLLSGGLDGRMMVAAAGRALTCYCFGDYENPEFDVARQVAAARGFEIRFLQRDADHYPDMVDRAVELGSGMHPFNHAHALGFVEQIAAESPVLTHGYGVEALFRGTTLPKREGTLCGFPARPRLDPTLTAANLASRYHRRAYSLLDRYPRLFSGAAAADIAGGIEESARQTIAEAAPHCANLYDQLLWSDVFARCRYTGYLFLLSLRPYVKERSVLFDNRVIDLHLRLPLHLRSDDRLWIRAMARLDRRVARAANANTGLRPGAPRWLAAGARTARRLRAGVPGLARTAHRGTAAPAAGMSPISWPRFDWLIQNNRRLRSLLADTIDDPRALPADIFDRAQAKALLAEHLEGRARHRDILFALLTFGRWHVAHAAGR